MKDELGGKLTKELAGLKTKIYCYLTDDSNESKKVKVIKNVLKKEHLNLKFTKIV